MNAPQTLGERLGWYRRAQGLSRPRLASLTGLHYQTITQIELENCNITVSTLQKLAQALGVSCGHLLGERAPFEDLFTSGSDRQGF